MKAFVSKPVQILGKQFDGTRKSAKEITDWIKSNPNSRYNSAELNESVTKYGFLDDVTGQKEFRCTLRVHTDSSQLLVYPSDWIVLYVDTGEYSSYSDERLRENYAEL